MAKKSIEARVKAEKDRLAKAFQDLPEETATAVAGLIDQAAWERIQIEDLEKDIEQHGWATIYQQSPNLPSYERVRPQATQYPKMIAGYQRTIKQLQALLPKPPDVEIDDGFEEFLHKYDD